MRSINTPLDTPVSPALIYKISNIDSAVISSLSSSDGVVCEGDKCSSRISLNWKKTTSCKSTTLCTTLNDNVCGDYGIVVGEGGRDLGNICYKNRFYSHLVSPEKSQTTIDLWWYQGAKFQATCYFWCTADGSVPASPSGIPISNEMLVSLVRNGLKLKL